MFCVVLGVAPQLAAEIDVLRRCSSAVDSRPSVADATRALSVVANGGGARPESWEAALSACSWKPVFSACREKEL